MRAFMKLKELQPQQAALLAQLDKAGELSDDDQECLDFITDEIQRLMEELQEHGFSFPECAANASVCTLHKLGVWPSPLRLPRLACASWACYSSPMHCCCRELASVSRFLSLPLSPHCACMTMRTGAPSAGARFRWCGKLMYAYMLQDARFAFMALPPPPRLHT